MRTTTALILSAACGTLFTLALTQAHAFDMGPQIRATCSTYVDNHRVSQVPCFVQQGSDDKVAIDTWVFGNGAELDFITKHGTTTMNGKKLRATKDGCYTGMGDSSRMNYRFCATW